MKGRSLWPVRPKTYHSCKRNERGVIHFLWRKRHRARYVDRRFSVGSFASANAPSDAAGFEHLLSCHWNIRDANQRTGNNPSSLSTNSQGQGAFGRNHCGAVSEHGLVCYRLWQPEAMQRVRLYASPTPARKIQRLIRYSVPNKINESDVMEMKKPPPLNPKSFRSNLPTSNRSSRTTSCGA